MGFWEVGGALPELPAEAQYGPQRAFYHVTDKASLVGCTAKAAFELLRAVRRGELHPDWRIVSLPALPGHAGRAVAGKVTAHGDSGGRVG